MPDLMPTVDEEELTRPDALYSGDFGAFTVTGALLRGSGACGKRRQGWLLTLRETAAAAHTDGNYRYWVCEGDFRKLLEDDLRQDLGRPSWFEFEEGIASVPEDVRQTALEAIRDWESRFQPDENRCLARCTAAQKMGTDFCTVF